MYDTILLPLDLGDLETQDKAISTAELLAKSFNADLHLLAIVPDPGVGFVTSFFPEGYQEKALEHAMEHLNAFIKKRFPNGPNATAHVGHGGIYREILRKAKDCGADLIVMASHRPEFEDYLIGGNTSRVVRHADCSVVVVRN